MLPVQNTRNAVRGDRCTAASGEAGPTGLLAWCIVPAFLLITAGCARHPTLPALPLPATRTPAIAVDPETGQRRLQLSVLIYNVAGLPWPVRTGRSAALRQIGRQLEEMRAAGTAPDLLLLQEAFTAEAARIGVRAGYLNGVRGPRRTDRPGIDVSSLDRAFLAGRRFFNGEKAGKLLSSGLYIYSDYPIHALYSTPFGRHTCAGFDCLANKGVMVAEITIPGVPARLQLLNTHLNSRAASGVSHVRSLYAHNRQVDEIATLLARTRHQDQPFIFGGDFNTRRSEARFDYKIDRIPGTVVDYYCVVEADDCDVRISWDGDAPWMDTQDLQGFESGTLVAVRPIRVEAMFDQPYRGRMLSDHDGYLVTYELSW